jgi:sialidase-1
MLPQVKSRHTVALVLLAGLGLLVAAGRAAAAEPSLEKLEKTDIFTARTGGYHHYRVPGIVVTAKGTILAYSEARKSSGDWSDNDILLRRSTDGGRTWSEPAVLADGAGFEGFNTAAARFRKGDNAGAVTCSNAVMIVDADGRTVHCLYCIEYARCFYTRSTDDGLTFSAPVEITAAFEPFRPEYDWKVLATGPGHGIQLRSGRLLVPVWLSTGEGGGGHRPSCVSTIYSDDGGATWNRGRIVAGHPELVNPSETLPLELADGRVMLNIRNESPERRRAVSFSLDGATGWTKPVFDDELYEPVCMASLVRLSLAADGGRNRIVFANPDSRAIPEDVVARRGRQNVTVKLSCDEGDTWPAQKVLDAGPSGYTDLAIGPDGTIYCIYERGAADPKQGAFDPAAVCVARFNAEWIAE